MSAYENLPVSRAVKAADLARVMGLSLREVNDLVRTLRKRGVLVGAAKDKPYGYYLPQTDDYERPPE